MFVMSEKIKCSHILVKKQSEALSIIERLEKGESFDMQWLNIGSKSVQGIVQEEYSYANAITQMKQCKNTPNVNSG